MMVKKFKFEKNGKGTLKIVRYLTAVFVIVFVITFLVAINQNTKVARETLKNVQVSLATTAPFAAFAPIDLTDEYYDFFEEDAPEEALPIAAEVLEWRLPSNGGVMVGFSDEDLVYNRTMEDWRVHLGIDFEGDIGASVFASADGMVKTVGNSEEYGNFIEIEHVDGYVSRYCNLQDNPPVKKGEKVSSGQIIAGVGRSAAFEIGDAPHLHFEILLNGERIDPMSLI